MFFPREHCHEYHDLEVTLQNLGGTSPKKITVRPWIMFFQKKNDVFQSPLSYFAGTDWSPFLSHKLSWIGVYPFSDKAKKHIKKKVGSIFIHHHPFYHVVIPIGYPHVSLRRSIPAAVVRQYADVLFQEAAARLEEAIPGRSSEWRSDFCWEKSIEVLKKKNHVWWKLLWTCLMVILDGHIHCHFHTVIFMIMVNGHCYRHF